MNTTKVPAHKETARHLEAFEEWYSLNRNFRKTAESCSISERSLYAWGEWFQWHARADGRDRESQRLNEEEAARARADRQKRRRQAGELLTARGLEWLSNFKIENARDAIQAIKIGTEIERREDGIPDWVLMILGASPDELEKFLRQLDALQPAREKEPNLFEVEPVTVH